MACSKLNKKSEELENVIMLCINHDIEKSQSKESAKIVRKLVIFAFVGLPINEIAKQAQTV